MDSQCSPSEVEQTERDVETKGDTLPELLRQLWECSLEELTEGERDEVAQLLH